jgi:hypothetical protein
MRPRVHALASNRRGSVLPLAILVIVLLMAGALAGLMRMSAERSIIANLEGELEAFGLAEGGLSRYLAFVTAPPPASLDTVITGLPGGTDSISVRRLRAADGGLPALYVIRSTSLSTASARFDARTPTARRSIAQFATWQAGTMAVNGAWTSITGLKKKGGAGTISGIDQCGIAPSVAGVAVPAVSVTGSPGYDQNGGSSVPIGSPPIGVLAATPAAVAPLIKIDWSGIVKGSALPADYGLTGSSGWPSSFSDWPIVLVRNSGLTLGPGHSGQGLLVVSGDLTIHGSFEWDGVILVGGTLTSSGNNTLRGAIVTGLNLKLGQAVGPSDVGNGTKTIQYNSCLVSRALSSLGSLVGLANAWADNWPVY